MSAHQNPPALPAGLEWRNNTSTDNPPQHTPVPPHTRDAHTQGQQATKSKSKRANISIASLNMNGFTAPSRSLNGIEKWSTVTRTMNKHKIAILALQETHLDAPRLNDVLSVFGHKYIIITSSDPVSPRSSAGVAFVINKKFIKPNEITFHELHKGRALAIKLKWHEPEQEETVLLNIYAPNNKPEHDQFWRNIEAKRRIHRLRRPDFMLGDFNLTEDIIDRSPAHPDDPHAITALREIRQKWELQDTWRHTHPHDRCFTYRANANGQQIQSRLDRIYTSKETSRCTFDWEMCPTSTPTDHWLVKTKYAPRNAPHIGHGRWTWPTASLQNDKLMTRIINRGIQLQNDIERNSRESTDRNTSNTQTLWHKFKNDIKMMAKENTAIARYKINSKITAIENDIKELDAHPDFDTNEELRSTEAWLGHELAHLHNINARTQRETLHAKIADHGERLGGIWSTISKESKPRDLIRRLKIPNSNPPQYERHTERMANLAKDYHNRLQSEELPDNENHEEYTHALNEILTTIPESQHLDDPIFTPLNWKATQEQTEEALRLSKNGSATGMDGCPYELWKNLQERYNVAHQINKEAFNVCKVLTEVFNDIQTHGVDPKTEFALGWMCPIYKKKDPTEISNYRPITLMNTDYKLLTKVLALQLSPSITSLVHEDQAGFIPKRSIFNHIRLAKSIINYAEVMEENGAIIALDQEKAYDKIRHDYLWKTLDAFNVPQTFTKTVKSLYQNARTQVAINGVFSDPFPITRGVRQGDPLSCFLFDLAIEPLACMIRSDPNLHGINIPGINPNILVTMFADDTTLFLSENDRLDDAQRVLDQWCRVSGAKFNIEKTEIIPIGTENHRSTVVRTRKINPRDEEPLNDRTRIAEDGQATRSLGAWIGNHVNDLTPWEPILDKVHHGLEKWRRTRPTLHGRRLIIQTIIGGHTQFLTKAQGMPAEIENALTKITRDFIWEDDSSPRIALEILFRPIEEGGLNLLDIKARNDAIEITWLRDYLNFSPSRPIWAKVTDLILKAAAPPGTSTLARINSFLQSWNPPTRGRRLTLLNNDTIRMLKAGRKHKTNLAAIRLSPDLRGHLPAWYHLKAAARPLTTRVAKCLMETHSIATVADLITASARLRNNGQIIPHTHDPQCLCNDCANDRVKGCNHPHECAADALARIHLIVPKLNPLEPGDIHDNLSLTPTRKNNNREARANDGKIRFDPSITCKRNLAECFRIFTNPSRISNLPARRTYTVGVNHRHQGITVYTDGACINNGKLDAQCGSGVWIAPNHAKNAAIRIPGPHQSNQVGEIAAIIAAIDSFPKFWPLTIISDSKYAIDGLTTHLHTWEDNGWIGIKNADLFRRAAFLLRSRIATTDFQWVKGHNGTLGNEESDRLAREGVNKPNEDVLNLEIPKEFDLQGAKLASMTQATAYHGIRENRKPREPRNTTIRNLENARNAIHEYSNNLETDESIWKGTRNPNIRTRVQQFLYKTLHGTQKIGNFWSNIRDYETRQNCTICNTIESMEHILTQCAATPTRIIWNLARNTWPHDLNLWPEISIGTIMGCGSLTIPGANPPRDARNPPRRTREGQRRLLQILISESAHLIWVLRCERVIQEHSHTANETYHRWLRAINTRLTDDKIIATRIKRDEKSERKVRNTWEHVLRKQEDLPDDWITSREVLVGRGARHAGAL